MLPRLHASHLLRQVQHSFRNGTVGPSFIGRPGVSALRERIDALSRRQKLIGGAVVLLALVLVFKMMSGGSGGSGTTPSAAGTPVPTGIHVASATPVGARVQTDSLTPAAVTAALRNQEIVVVAFVMRGQADDDAVASAVAGLASPQQSIAGVKYLVYNVADGAKYGDLATILGVTGTPSVVIIGSDGRIANAWNGFVDASVIQAALSQAISSGG
jgi:hypothetical protein